MLKLKKKIKRTDAETPGGIHPATNNPALSDNVPSQLSRLRTGFFNLGQRSIIVLLIIVVGTACLGTYLLLFGHADNPGAFTENWQTLGGATNSGPAVASTQPNNLYVAVRGTNNHVYYKSWWGAGWSGWNDIGGQTYYRPSVISLGPGNLNFFVTGTDGQVYQKWYDHGTWSGWIPLGGKTIAAPAVSSWGSSNCNIYVTGTDHQIYAKYLLPTGWSGWNPLGGQTNDAPIAVSMAYDNANIFVRGTDDHVYQQYFSGTTWSGWFEVGQGWQTHYALGVSSWGPTRLDLFMTGYDNHVYDLPFNAETGWGHWQGLGADSIGPPAAASWGPGRIDIFATGTDNAVWSTNYNTGVPVGSYISIGASIHLEQSLISPSGTYQAQVQSDGNFVVRRNSDGAAIWATGTNGSGASELDFQTDGNLVLRPPGGAAAWASGTNTYGGNVLIMQDDGNLVMYNSSTARAVWSWETGKIPPPPPPPKPTASLTGYVPGNATSAQIASAKAILVNNSTVISSGKMPLLNYNCTDSTTGYINGIQIAGTKGSIYKPAITQPTTYTLTCVGPGGSASSTFNVTTATLNIGAPSADESLLLNDLNGLRKSVGVATLPDTVCLDQAAREWSETMGAAGVNSAGLPNRFAHSGEPSSMGGIGRNISLSYCSIGNPSIGGVYAENIAWTKFSCTGTPTDTCAQLAFNSLKASSKHYANMTDPLIDGPNYTWTNTGVGEYVDTKNGVLYVTQEFMRCLAGPCTDNTRAGYGYP